MFCDAASVGGASVSAIVAVKRLKEMKGEARGDYAGKILKPNHGKETSKLRTQR